MPVNGKKALFAAAGLMALTAAATGALAGGFQIHEQSAEFQGLSFAGTAAGGAGLSSMFWNPATITRHEGMKSDSNGTLILPYSRARNESQGLLNLTPLSSDSGNIGRNAFVPASYSSWQLNDMIWLGLGMNAPYGLTTRNGRNSKGAVIGYKSKIVTFDITPTVAIKLNDMISIAAGMQINYMKGDLSSLGYAPFAIPSTRIKGDDWGVGFTAGLLLTPVSGTSIGLGYRSRVKHTLKGRFTINNALVLPASVKHTLPDQLTFSVRQSLTDDFDILGSIEWTNWSLFKRFSINAPGGPYTDVYNWKDSWMFSIGGEYRYSSALTLRAGYAYEKSPVPDTTRNVRLPDNDRHWLSVGASWVASDWLTMHLGYSHLFAKNGSVNRNVGLPGGNFTATYKNHINIVSAGVTINTGKLFFSN